MLLALRRVGGGPISWEKALRNTWMAPQANCEHAPGRGVGQCRPLDEISEAVTLDDISEAVTRARRQKSLKMCE